MKIWFKIMGLLAFFFGSYLASYIIVAMFYEFAYEVNIFENNKLEVEMALVGDTLFCLILIGFVFWRRRRLAESCHFEKPKTSVFFVTIPLAICLNLFLTFVMPFVPLDESAIEMQEMFKPFLEAPLWMQILILGVFAAVNEELMMRGLIFHELRRKMPIIVAVVVQGTLFGLLHMNLFQVAYAAPMGILLGFIYVWTRSIWITMSIHFFNNLTSTLLSNYVAEDISGSIIYSIFFFVLTIVFIVWLYRLQFADRTVATMTNEKEAASI
ncbi:CPBP family intramembrane glutamic endopeptidase [Risungbinella massiliensis]|uniref:CPBP family intramembrane glutamic endopeptidase n=1 Tax=Risungbinella massiliensis TaxID=1329796 RepID=UPI0005CC7DBF|nr:CPBP family intramembrane glutamic endopeptidase [Risungbinella massiliensis]